MRSVLITRPQPQADALAELLRAEGFAPHVAPLSVYAALPAQLPALAGYDALVFTSARGVEIFSARSPERALPVFCVGEASARAAEGFSEVHAAAGDSAALAGLLKQKRGLKKILHVCGADTARDLQALLPGVTVDRAEVYKAELASSLPPDVSDALKRGRIGTVTLFSARSASALARILREDGIASDTLEALCLSGRVAEALSPLPWKSIRTARAPRLDCMLELLRAGPAR